jgi:hypothetical protein
VAGGVQTASGAITGGEVAAELGAHIEGLLPGLSGYRLQLGLQLIAQLAQLLQDLLALGIGGLLDAVQELGPLLLELLQEGLHIPGQRGRRGLAGSNNPM